MRFLYLYLLVFLIMGCNTQNNNSSFPLNRANFPTTIQLKHPETIVLKNVSDPVFYKLLNDSVILVQNQPTCNYFFELYSLIDRKKFANLAPKGNGPNEFSSLASFYSQAGSDPVYYVIDDNHTLYLLDMDSTIAERKLYIKDKFRLNDEVHSYPGVCLSSNYYIGYNKWFLDDPEYNNHVFPLKKYPIHTDSRKEYNVNTDDGDKFIVFAINNVQLFWDWHGEYLWMADSHNDKIKIYDDSLHLKKCICGPDFFNITHTIIVDNIVGFPKNKDFRSYSSYTVTPKHIYLVFEGINGTYFDDTQFPSSVEIFKFDQQGNFICNYLLDKYVYNISLDANEEYLYCTTRESFFDEAYFIRYKL